MDEMIMQQKLMNALAVVFFTGMVIMLVVSTLTAIDTETANRESLRRLQNEQR